MLRANIITCPASIGKRSIVMAPKVTPSSALRIRDEPGHDFAEAARDPIGRRRRLPGPRSHPFATAMRPPATRNTWPVIPADCRARQPGDERRDVVGVAFVPLVPRSVRWRARERFSVIRVSAPGAMALTVTP